jgi:hypothetical protein
MSTFLYALKAPESRRQYPRRFKMFLDFLKLQGTIEEQAMEFLIKGRQTPQGAQSTFMKFGLAVHLTNAQEKVLSAATGRKSQEG